MQLRKEYWMTPEAVFEIVGAGSEIPSGFVQPEGLILEGPWIEVAICAVIFAHPVDGYVEAKYMPEDSHLHVTKVGVRFIRQEYIESNYRYQTYGLWSKLATDSFYLFN
ncbi:hypothetical protein L1987_80584 [Smallanthus sonchifolius]|uniref:Uncharacterized protein n=1 Tax=Smallanthus sonchifolius TaxID=185202 RepID=A0ACB8YPB0_9ASTR|nr:hypothetical protein L1987_80584 [Smallanthus sonchifolius]